MSVFKGKDHLIRSGMGSFGNAVLNRFFRTHSTGITPLDFWGDHLVPRDMNADYEELDAIINKE